MQSQYGWHVIRVDAHKAAQTRNFDDVKSGILAELREKYIRDTRDAAVTAVGTIRSWW